MSHKYSYSQIQLYASCGIKYLHRYVNQLVPLGATSEHDLRYGSAIDAGLSAYYSTGQVGRAVEAFTLSYPAHEYPSALPYWSPGKTFENGLAALEAYVEQYKDEDKYWQILQIQNINTGLEEEPESDSDRIVKLDLIVRDTRDDMVYGVDHKTTGKYLDKDFNAKFNPHSQIRQYVDWIQKTYGECGGFYINALSFKHRTKAYTPRSGPDKGVQQPAGDWFAFKRMVFTPNKEAVRLERDNFFHQVAKIERDKRDDTWTYNTDQCVKGPIICEYHGICANGYQWPRDSDLIEISYRQRCIRHAADGNRCWLEPEHVGEHDSTKPYVPDNVIELDNEIEESEV